MSETSPSRGQEPGRVLPPEVKQALAQARVNMRAKTKQMLTEHGLTPEQIAEFMAQIDKAGEELRRATSENEQSDV